jgi:hypothetical protein
MFKQKKVECIDVTSSIRFVSIISKGQYIKTSPIIGMTDVGGIVSETIFIKKVSDIRTVIPVQL